MRLAVSNIAWPRDRDAEVAGVLTGLGVRGIEVAPTKLWDDPLAAGPAEIDARRGFWADHGIGIVAAQSLLFGRPDLTLFDSAETRDRTLAYLRQMVGVCAGLGAGALVFGSPKNRRRGPLSADRAVAVAVDFFARLGEAAARAGTCVVIEPNPPAYGADFITHAREAVELVRAVDHPGVRLHLDTACLFLAGDDVGDAFDAGGPYLRHFHVSEPNLDPPGSADVIDHPAFAAELRSRGYAGWVSIEMRERQPFSPELLTDSIRRVQRTYGFDPMV